MLTPARLLTVNPMKSRGTGVLTSLTVEARATVAGAQGRVTGAVVETGTEEEAGGPKVPRWARLFTVGSHPT